MKSIPKSDHLIEISMNFLLWYKAGQRNAQPLEPLHIFLTGNVGCGKSFIMKVLYQSSTKVLSYGNVVSLDKPKVLLMTPTGVPEINLDGTTIHAALNMSGIFLLVYSVNLKKNTGETRKNVFNLTSKALFVLEIIRS